jgi:GT2 family glycosyltransferase
MSGSSIIIPVFNRHALTRQCLEAIFADGVPPGTEVVIVDDASEAPAASSLGVFDERIKVVRHSQNSGFAASCNDGAASASGDFLIFLNNDTIPQHGWVDALVGYAEEHPEAAAIGSKLLFPDGTIQHAGVVICQDRYPRHIYCGFPADHPAVNKSRPFQAVTAACVLIRRSAFEQAGGFDTRFRNGYEDVDLCLRLGQLGYQVHYCPDSVVHHLESMTRGDVPSTLEHNDALYQSLWHDRAQPDEVQYYLEDGLLELRFGPGEAYPLHLRVSPLLAIVDEHYEAEMASLLNARARQAFDLIKQNIHLSTTLLELDTTRQRRDAEG